MQGVPLAYLMEFAEFYHHRFFVNPSVLIPRPETELLVDLIVKEFKGKCSNVLDIGTGSGVILLSLLAAGVGTHGIGGDISSGALEVAKINTARLKLSEQVSLIQSDRFEKIKSSFDLIVSNPPYIKVKSHRSLVQDNVHQFEPHEALYLPDTEYEKWFETFFKEIHSHLNPGGVFFMEGHELEVVHQKELLERLGFKEVKVLKDYANRDRFLRSRA